MWVKLDGIKYSRQRLLSYRIRKLACGGRQRRTGIGADKAIELNDYRGSYADEEGLQLGIKMFSLRSFLAGRWEMGKFEHKSKASKIKN